MEYIQKDNVRYIVGVGLIVFCLFPFINFINIGTDMQPYALLFSLIYVMLINGRNMHFTHYLFFLFIALLYILSSFQSRDYYSPIRSLLNYLSIGIIPYSVKEFLNESKVNVQKIIKISIIVWFIVGIIQLSVSSDFLSTFVANYRTSTTRGVGSLASEPSFYGYMAFFFLLFSLTFSNGFDKILYSILSFLQILFIAQSTVSLIYVIIIVIAYFGYYLSQNRSIKQLFAVIVASVVIVVAFVYILRTMPNARISQFIVKFYKNPEAILTDESVQQRSDHITLSLKGFLSAYGLPHGYAQFITTSKRIMSGYGALLYELGVFGIVVIIDIFFIIKKKYNIFVALGCTIIMMSAIQIGSPIFALFIGYCMTPANRNIETDSDKMKIYTRSDMCEKNSFI